MFKTLEQRFEDFLEFLNLKTIRRRSVTITYADNELRKKSNFVGIVLRFKAGSAHESENSLYEGFHGYCNTAHLLEHCVAREIITSNPKLFKLGETLNAITGHYATVYYGKVSKRYWKDFFSSMIGKIRDFKYFENEKILKTELERIIAEEGENNKEKVIKTFYKNLLNNPWINMQYIDFESFKFKPREKEIKAFYEKFYTRRNLEMYMGKNLSKENLEFIAMQLETLPLGTKVKKPEFIYNPRPGVYALNSFTKQPEIAVGCVLNNTRKNSLDVSLLNDILVKKEFLLSYPLGLCYSIDTSIQNYGKKVNTIEIVTTTVHRKRDEIIKRIIENILYLKDNGVNEKTFSNSLNDIKKTLDMNIEDLDFLLDLKLKKNIGELKNLLKSIDVIKSDENYLDKFNSFLKKIIPEKDDFVIVYEKNDLNKFSL